MANKHDLVYNRVAGSYYEFEDILRLKEHIDYLATKFPVQVTSQAFLDNRYFLRKTDLQKYLDDVESLRSVAPIFSFTPTTPNISYYNYVSANKVEKILYDIETAYDNKIAEYKYCGQYTTNQEINL